MVLNQYYKITIFIKFPPNAELRFVKFEFHSHWKTLINKKEKLHLIFLNKKFKKPPELCPTRTSYSYIY